MDLTRVDIASLPPGRNVLRFLMCLWDQVNRDKVLIRASGLAYSTLLAIVPLGAVVFALFSAFGAFDSLSLKVNDLLISRILPGPSEEISGYIDHFIDNAGNLGFVGFIGLIVTSILLLDSIESNFNEIWHARQRRRLIPKITAYTSVLVFGTIFIGLSVTISAGVKALWLTNAGLDLPLITRLSGWLFPLIANFLAFLLMFLIIPFSRVRLRSAAVGALAASLAWELSKSLFALTISQSVRYSTLYGSLAAVPLFLIWLYITWMLVLLGLEVAYTHQNFAALTRTNAAGECNGREHLSSALKLLVLIARPFERGDQPPTVDQLAETLVLPLDVVEEHVSRLAAANLIRAVDAESDSPGFVPAASPDGIMVADVVATTFGAAVEPSSTEPPLDRVVGEALSEFQAGGGLAIESLSLKALIQRIP